MKRSHHHRSDSESLIFVLQAARFFGSVIFFEQIEQPFKTLHALPNCLFRNARYRISVGTP
jgi:hypothetical protein